MSLTDETHEPVARSWVESANRPESEFPLQNLPFGVFRRKGTREAGRVGVAIGDAILDVAAAADVCGFSGSAREAAAACRGSTLNTLLAMGREHWSALRRALFYAASVATPEGKAAAAAPRVLTNQADAELLLPFAVANYTDFYASIYHASNGGRILGRPEPVRESYHYLPVAYHGRASSVVVSGTPVKRPKGQFPRKGEKRPIYAPSENLDYEFEVGIVIGPGNPLGTPIPIDEAEAHVFGLCLLNDWSARDIQFYEGQPLGPFLGKSFATAISPWIVTLEALAPFRVSMPPRPEGAPVPLAHLTPRGDAPPQAFDMALECWLTSAASRAAAREPFLLSRGNFRDLYWSVFQMVAHHTSNGCNLRPGDLFGSGTASGPTPDSLGCLLERTEHGRKPFTVEGEIRTYLEDGDQVTFRAFCRREGFRSIGFGACSSVVEPA